MSERKVWILSGIPGSGKSTWAGREIPAGRTFSADDWFTTNSVYQFRPQELPLAHQACFRGFLRAVQEISPRPVAVDNTNLSAWEIAPYMLAAEAHDWEVAIVRVHCPLAVALERQTHGVPPERLAAMARAFDRRDVLPWWTVHEVL